VDLITGNSHDVTLPAPVTVLLNKEPHLTGGHDIHLFSIVIVRFGVVSGTTVGEHDARVRSVHHSNHEGGHVSRIFGCDVDHGNIVVVDTVTRFVRHGSFLPGDRISVFSLVNCSLNGVQHGRSYALAGIIVLGRRNVKLFFGDRVFRVPSEFFS
jgi:hypothetical protein